MSVFKIQDHEVLIDDEDLKRVEGKNWYLKTVSNPETKGYYFRSDVYNSSDRSNILLHRFIVSAEPGQIVDHINGNTRDNRKSNLRIITNIGNSQNRKIQSVAGGIAGVRKQNNGRFYVSLRANYKRYFIGSFENEMVAEYELMKACNKYHGEFSRYARFKKESKR